jgi:DNA-binding CsgD family transcriptional regulator
MFDAVTSVGDPQAAYLQILDASIQLTDAFGGHFAYCEETLKQGRLVDHVSGDSTAMKKIADDHPHYIFENPIWPYLAAFKGNVLRHLDVVPAHNWENCEFFSGFVRPNRLRDGLCVLFRDSKGSTIWAIGLMYDQKMKFNKSALKTLQYIAPYLSRGIQNLEEWTRRWKTFNNGDGVEKSDQPLIALKHGRLMFACGGAEKILNFERSDFTRSLWIQELIRLCRFAAQPGARVRWNAENGAVYRLSSISVSKDDLQLVNLVPVKAALPDPDQDMRMAQDKGLTLREAQVFKLMARGMAYREIARDLGLSLHTVRTHIRHIYSKLHVTGYVEAINAVRS